MKFFTLFTLFILIAFRAIHLQANTHTTTCLPRKYEHIYASELIGETTIFTSREKLGFSSGSVRFNSLAWGVNAGVRFSSFLALEAAYLKIADLRIRSIRKNIHGKIQQQFPSFGLRFFFPFYEDRFDISFLAGTGLLKKTSSPEVRENSKIGYLKKMQDQHWRPYFDLKLEYQGIKYISFGFGLEYIQAHRTSSDMLFPHFSLKLTF